MKIYIYHTLPSIFKGGYDKTLHMDRASVECYDPSTDDWTFVTEMEKARSGLSLIAIDHNIYMIGGRYKTADQYFDVAERYGVKRIIILKLDWKCLTQLKLPVPDLYLTFGCLWEF